MNILCMDFGNSAKKYKVFTQGTSFDEPVRAEQRFINFDTLIKANKFDYIFLATVNHTASEHIAKMLRRHPSQKHLWINSKSTFPFSVNYGTPDTLGVDRLCGLTGALSFLRSDFPEREFDYLVTLDFGTALTGNVLNLKTMEFIGGIIAPGPTIISHAVHHRTYALPKPEHKDWGESFGTDTMSAVGAGVYHTIRGCAESFIKLLKQKYSNNIAIYMTGGNSRYFLRDVDFRSIYKQDLVLRGIYETGLHALNNQRTTVSEPYL